MSSRNLLKRELPLHLMLFPGIVILFVYCYVPMGGIAIAFQQFVPIKGLLGSEWIGWANFQYMLDLPDIRQVVWNTLYISFMKIAAGLAVPIVIAILLNEVRLIAIKKTFQTLVYLPHFLSWIIISGIMIDVLSPSQGIVNMALKAIGLDPVFFLGSNGWFPVTLVASDVWKEFGFGTIVYLAAIAGINPTLYEAAVIDGAGRWRQIRHVTLPGMLPVIVLLATLSLGNVLNAGFEQVFNLYSPSVYESGDILDTLIYRIGILDAQFGVATAIGLLKSFVSLILISLSYVLAYRLANYRIF